MRYISALSLKSKKDIKKEHLKKIETEKMKKDVKNYKNVEKGD
jgi:hypothetical protein